MGRTDSERRRRIERAVEVAAEGLMEALREVTPADDAMAARLLRAAEEAARLRAWWAR